MHKNLKQAMETYKESLPTPPPVRCWHCGELMAVGKIKYGFPYSTSFAETGELRGEFAVEYFCPNSIWHQTTKHFDTQYPDAGWG